MKKIRKSSISPKPVLWMALFFLTIDPANGQAGKPADRGYVPVNGTKIYYEVYGQGQPLVLLHGAFMTIAGNWGELIPELAKTRTVIALEFQGHGHSPFSERTLSHATLAQDVAAVMDHLQIERADVVGYSLGGSVAYQLAMQSPRRVNQLVIISSTYKSSGWRAEINNAFKSMTPALLANSPMQAAYDAVAPDKTNWTQFVAQMIGFAATPFDMGDGNLAKITSPVLLISGDNDGLDKVELMKTYQALGGGVSADLGPMPASHLAIVPGQGHVSLMGQTQTLLAYLAGFLQ